MHENPERVTYKEAGAAGRYVLQWASYAEPALKHRELRVVMAVVGMTTLYSKTSDRMSLEQIAKASNLHPKTVSKVLRSFRDRPDCPILYRPGDGRGGFSVVAIETPIKGSHMMFPFTDEKGEPNEPKRGAKQPLKGSHVTGNSVPTEVLPPSKAFPSQSAIAKKNPDCPACGEYGYDCPQCTGYQAASPARRRSA